MLQLAGKNDYNKFHFMVWFKFIIALYQIYYCTSLHILGLKLAPKITQAWNFWIGYISGTVDDRNLIFLQCICKLKSLILTGSEKTFLHGGNIAPIAPKRPHYALFKKTSILFKNIKLLINAFPAICCLCLYYVSTLSYKNSKFGHAWVVFQPYIQEMTNWRADAWS